MYNIQCEWKAPNKQENKPLSRRLDVRIVEENHEQIEKIKALIDNSNIEEAVEELEQPAPRKCGKQNHGSIESAF